MRLTFPSLSSTGSTYLFQVAALATLPTLTCIVAKRVLPGAFFTPRQAVHVSLGISVLSAATLVRNPWSLGSSVGIFMLYLSSFSGAQKKTRKTLGDGIPQWDIAAATFIATGLIKIIESKTSEKFPKIYSKPLPVPPSSFQQFLDNTSSKNSGPNVFKVNDWNGVTIEEASDAFKGLFVRLEPRLLAGIQEDLVNAQAAPKNVRDKKFQDAFAKLSPEYRALLKMTMNHLVNVAISARFETNSDELFKDFVIPFFGEKASPNSEQLQLVLASLSDDFSLLGE